MASGEVTAEDLASGYLQDKAIDIGLRAILGIGTGANLIRKANKVGLDDFVEGVTKSVASAKKSTTLTALGHYPDDVKVSDNLAARRCDIPEAAWNKMPPAEQRERIE